MRKVIKEIKSFITKRYKILLVIFMFLNLTAAGLFLPLLYDKSTAKKGIKDVSDRQSTRFSQSFWKKLWEPEYIIYAYPKGKDSEIYLVELHRKYIFFWDRKIVKKQVKSPSENIKDNSDKNTQEINDGAPLALGDLPKEARDAIKSSEEMSRAGYVQIKFSNNKGTEVKTIQGAELYSNEVLINEKKISDLKNVYNISFDIDGENLFYTKYKIKSEDMDPQVFQGVIYKYNLQTKKEELVYDFGYDIFVSLKANREKVVYAMPSKEVGTVDLKTKQKKSTLELQKIYKIGDGEPSDNLFGAWVSVLSVSQNEAVLEVDAKVKEYYRLDLNTLNLQKYN